MRLLRMLVVAALAALPGRELEAQGCCTAGSSSPGLLDGGVAPFRVLHLSAGYQYTSLTSAWQGSVSVEDPLERVAAVAYVVLSGEYGVFPGLSFGLGVPVADRSREITLRDAQGRNPESVRFGAAGLADVLAVVKYRVAGRGLPDPWHLDLGGGVMLPTGSHTREQDNAQLALDLQPGTGTLQALAWASGAVAWPAAGLELRMGAWYRYAGVNLDGYRLGDELVVSAGVEKGVGEYFGIGAGLRSRVAARDFASRRVLPGTGGIWHDLELGVGYRDGASAVRVFSWLPLYRNVRGIQLAPTYSFGVAYRHALEFPP